MERIILFFIMLFTSILMVKAQGYPHPANNNDPDKIATMYADMLERELSLNKKQRKKIYKIALKQAKKVQSERPAQRPSGGSPGMGMGRGNMGAGPGMGGQRPGMGGGSRPGGGGESHPMKGESSEEKFRFDKESYIPGESEKDIQEREFKMKKILDATQFTRWQEIEKERIKKEEERRKFEEQERLFPRHEKKNNFK